VVTCLFCKGTKHIVRAGFRNNASGKKQRYCCNVCERLFVPNDGFWKMKTRPEVIAEAISWHCPNIWLSIANAKSSPTSIIYVLTLPPFLATFFHAMV